MPAAGSALVSFEGLDVLCGLILIYARGDRDNVRKALRRACSHRRRLVSSRPTVYFLNSVHALLSAVGGDSADYLGPDRKGKKFLDYRPTVNWHYRIYLQDRIPRIRYGELDKEEYDRPLFEWLGTEVRKPYVWTEARKANKGGRPTGFRKSNPEMMQGLDQKKFLKHQKIADGVALGLKDKPKTGKGRLVHVDFSEVMTPMQSLSNRDRIELDPDWQSNFRGDAQ